MKQFKQKLRLFEFTIYVSIGTAEELDEIIKDVLREDFTEKNSMGNSQGYTIISYLGVKRKVNILIRDECFSIGLLVHELTHSVYMMMEYLTESFAKKIAKK